MSANCPMCGQVDMVQKVSSTYSNEVSSAYGLGRNQTELSIRLAPPEKTGEEVKPIAKYVGAIVVLLGYLSCTVFLTLLSGGNAGLFLLLVLGSGLLSAVFYDDARKKELRYRRENPAWNAVARWNRLYYCFRDDIVFDPKTGKNCKPAEMATLFVDEEAT